MSLSQRILTGLQLFIRYPYDFWHANLTIVRQVLSPQPTFSPAIIEIPTKAESPIELLILANLISFTPGTLVLDIIPGKHVRVHVLDDAESVRQELQTRIEHPLLTLSGRYD